MLLFFTSEKIHVFINDIELYQNNVIIKVSHHGSRTATSPILFQMIQPNVAMIGVKKKNMYRHPSQEVIQRLNRKGIHILRTDEDGMFHIRYYGRGDYMIFQ